MSTDEDRPPASAAETLRLIDEQRAAAERSLRVHPLTFFGPWGLAWLLGFGVMFLRYGPDGRIFVPMPGWLPLALLFALLIGAAVISGYIASRTYRHIRGPSSVQGAMYGVAWFVSFTGMGFTLSRFDDALRGPDLSLLWSTVAVGLVGALHMAGAAIWRDRLLFGAGVWITLINVIGTVLGPGWHSLVISLAGGGAGVVLGTVLWLRKRWARS